MTEFDLFVLICCGGRERTLEEFLALGRDAGLSLQSVLNGYLMEFAPVPPLIGRAPA